MKYETPEMLILMFKDTDVIKTSSVTENPNPGGGWNGDGTDF